MPSLGVDGLADTAQHPDRAEIVAADVLLTETTEETDGGGSSVEVGDLVLLNCLPVTGWGGVNGGGFEDNGSDTVSERSVDGVADEI